MEDRSRLTLKRGTTFSQRTGLVEINVRATCAFWHRKKLNEYIKFNYVKVLRKKRHYSCHNRQFWLLFLGIFSQIANSIVHRSFVNKLIDFFYFDDPLQRLYQSIHHHPCLFSRYAIVVPNWFSTLIVVTISPSRIYKQFTFALFTILGRVQNSHFSRTSVLENSTT